MPETPEGNPYSDEDAPDLLDELFDEGQRNEHPIELPPWYQGAQEFADTGPRVTRQRYWDDDAPGTVGGRDPRDPMDQPSGEVLGQLFWTPAMIASYMDQTNAMFAAVNAEYTKAQREGKLPAEVRDAWNGFAAVWKRFYQSNRESWAGGTVDRAEDFRKQLQTWHSKAAQYTTVTTPAPHVEPQGAFSKAFDWGGGFTTGAIIAVAVVAYLVSRR